MGHRTSGKKKGSQEGGEKPINGPRLQLKNSPWQRVTV